MKPEQLTLRELLRDPVYRKWFMRKPALYPAQKLPVTTKEQSPWLVWVQVDEAGRWRRGFAEDYVTAFCHVKRMLEQGANDVTIFSRRRSYAPPAGLTSAWPSTHDWCPYCRRPTVFWYFRKHHALRQFRDLDLSDDRRCTICGIRLHEPTVYSFNHRDAAAS